MRQRLAVDTANGRPLPVEVTDQLTANESSGASHENKTGQFNLLFLLLLTDRRRTMVAAVAAQKALRMRGIVRAVQDGLAPQQNR